MSAASIVSGLVPLAIIIALIYNGYIKLALFLVFGPILMGLLFFIFVVSAVKKISKNKQTTTPPKKVEKYMYY